LVQHSGTVMQETSMHVIRLSRNACSPQKSKIAHQSWTKSGLHEMCRSISSYGTAKHAWLVEQQTIYPCCLHCMWFAGLLPIWKSLTCPSKKSMCLYTYVLCYTTERIASLSKCETQIHQLTLGSPEPIWTYKTCLSLLWGQTCLFS